MSTKRKGQKRTSSPMKSESPVPPASAWLSVSGLPLELMVEDNEKQSGSDTTEPKRKCNMLMNLEGESTSSSPLTVQENNDTAKTFPFKDSGFVHSSKGTAGARRHRVWKSLKQIISNDKSLPWSADDVTYGSIEAPPSFKPAKKYSDLSGLPAKYTDPHTKLRYATADEFARLRVLPSDIVAGYLTLRKANPVVP